MAKTEVRGEQIKDASVSLTADVTGLLPPANGGTGLSNPAADRVLLSNSSSAFQTVAPGTNAGYVLASDGSTWVLTRPRPLAKQVTSATLGTIIPTGDTADQFHVTALSANAVISTPNGTPMDGQTFTLFIVDDGTPRTLTWSSSYRVIGVTLPTSTTANKVLAVGARYSSNLSKWLVLAVSQEV